MPRVRAFLWRYRAAFGALIASAAIHAAIIAGNPGYYGKADAPASPAFSATLEGGLVVDADPNGSAPTPTPRRATPKPRPKPRPASPPRPEEFIAQAPELAPQEAPAKPQPEQSEPDLPAQPLPDVDFKTEVLALAPITTIQKAIEPEKFPTHALPRRLKVTYSLTSAFADGKASYEWSREGDEYTITGEAFAEGFFALFLEGRVLQESRGKVTAEGLRPERFSESKPGSPAEGLEFDWDKRKVTFDRKGEKSTEQLFDNTVDWLTMIFQLAHRPPSGETFDLRVFTQRRLYTFRLKTMGEDVLDLPIGKVRALHLRHVDEEKKEYVDVWLGIDQHYMPVKLRFPVARNRFMVEQTATRISEESR